MDDFISRYFTTDPSKSQELLELIISERMEFSKKAAVFIHILRKRTQERRGNFNKEYKGINKDLKEIGEDRNKFAHSLCVEPITAQEKAASIVLIFFKDKARKPYAEADIDIIQERVMKYVKMIGAINRQGAGNPSA